MIRILSILVIIIALYGCSESAKETPREYDKYSAKTTCRNHIFSNFPEVKMDNRKGNIWAKDKGDHFYVEVAFWTNGVYKIGKFEIDKKDTSKFRSQEYQ
jgi:hypothetical protein